MLANYAEARHEAVKTIDIAKPPTARAPLRTYMHTHTRLCFTYRNTVAREYKRVLAPGTPITPYHDVDTILRRPEKFLQSGGKKTISLLPRNSSKKLNIDLASSYGEKTILLLLLLLLSFRRKITSSF